VETERIKRHIRYLLVLFTLALVMSGLTAVPIRWEIDILQDVIGEGTWMEQVWAPLAYWISFVHRGLTETSQAYPFIFYGTDWLAFAHMVVSALHSTTYGAAEGVNNSRAISTSCEIAQTELHRTQFGSYPLPHS
jgi:hypothetical protein